MDRGMVFVGSCVKVYLIPQARKSTLKCVSGGEQAGEGIVIL